MQLVYAHCAGLDVLEKTVSASVIVCEPDGKKRCKAPDVRQLYRRPVGAG
jgi:hypothetical protein